jgi:putative spermidine/putrescine transport system substrate-binding protein
MNRRDFLMLGAAAGGLVLTSRLATAAPNVIDVYYGGDDNIADFWANTVRPGFHKAYPDLDINWVNAADVDGMYAIADRAFAAFKTHTDPQADLFEEFDTNLPKGALEAGLWTDFSKANLTNYPRLNPLGIRNGFGLPYRASQVVIAYDTTKLSPDKAPKTWDALVAWIKANPGQFIYNRPDKGGSGGFFVRRAIHQANGLDPSKFTLDNYSDAYAAESLGKAWAILNDIAPSLYQGGAYTSGNTQSIQLLGQSVVTMVPVWSDQVLQAIDQGVLPSTTGLVQLTDLAICGDFVRMAIPTNAANHDAALKLVDYVLSDEIQTAILTDLGGFPGISWQYFPDDLRKKFADVVPTSMPTFPGGPWEQAVNDGWYRNVAPNIAR